MASVSESPVAIVTGAGRGLGREHALALAKAGYNLVINDLGGAGDGTGADSTPAQQVVAEVEALGQKAVADGSDVSNWQAAEGLIKKAVDTFGRLDALVNNAGILRDKTIANMSEEDWDLSIAVNLKGTAAPLRHAAAYWRDLSKKTGEPVNAAVVNTSSASGLYSTPGQSNYAAAKTGVASMSVVAARELSRYGVRVNAIAPIASTRLTESVMSDAMKEKLSPTYISPLVVYLLSDAAKDVTGRIIEIGGGAIMLADMPRPVAGMRKEGELWTAERIAEVMPGLLAQQEEPETSITAMQKMMATPLDSE